MTANASLRGPYSLHVLPSVFISSITAQLLFLLLFFFFFCETIWPHPPLCIFDSLQNPSLWRLRLAFVWHGGLYSSIYWSTKCFLMAEFCYPSSTLLTLWERCCLQAANCSSVCLQGEVLLSVVPCKCLLGGHVLGSSTEASVAEQAAGLWFLSREPLLRSLCDRDQVT